MKMETGVTGLLEHYLDTAVLQLKTTAENMANIDTPGYKTRGLDFDVQMMAALRADQQTKQAGGFIPLTEQSLVDGLVSRPDGNNVSMDREGMRMSEAQLKFRTGIALLRQQITQISDAIHSDTK